MLDRISFENKLRGMTDREVAEFTAKQLFEHCQNDHDHSHKKIYSINGIVSAIVAGILIALSKLIGK